MSDTPWLDPWCQHSIGLTCSNCAVPWVPPVEPETVFKRPCVPDRDVERFALDADVTVYWPWVRPEYQEQHPDLVSTLRRLLRDHYKSGGYAYQSMSYLAPGGAREGLWQCACGDDGPVGKGESVTALWRHHLATVIAALFERTPER